MFRRSLISAISLVLVFVTLVAVVALVTSALYGWQSGAVFLDGVMVSSTIAWPVGAVAVLLAGLAIAAAEAPRGARGVLYAVIAVVTLVGVTWSVVLGWHNSVEEPLALSKPTTVTSEAAPSYKLRTAYEVAVPLTMRKLPADLVGVERTSDGLFSTATMYVDGSWTTLLPAGTAARGYIGVASLRGDQLTVCKWDGEGSRLRFGAWANSLERKIREEVAHEYGAFNRVEFAVGDSYGYCDAENKPHVVVPLTERGAGVPQPVLPAGVAVFGPEREVRILAEVKPGQIPGPVYPLSVAAEQRIATKGNSTDREAIRRGEVGYEDSLSNGSDSSLGDPNAGNTGEFVLEREDGTGLDYVTPLTPAGGSKTVVGVSVIEADHVKRGELNALTVYRSEKVANFATQAGAIAVAFQDVPVLANKRSIIREFTPTGPDEWTATLGVENEGTHVITVSHVAVVSSTGTCLYGPDGTTRLGCVTPDGVAKGGSRPAQPGDGGGDESLASLTDDELIARANAALDELARRRATAGS